MPARTLFSLLLVLGSLACGGAARAQSFVVTLTNLTGGQTFSPSLFATHDASESVWELGTFASSGLRELAEESSAATLAADLSTQLGGSVGNLYVSSGPLAPGAVTTFTIQANAAHPLLSAAWMLTFTNDGFSGVNALNLATITGTASFDLVAYDAGTEVNNEDALFVPGLGGTLGDPERGVISLHSGLQGIGDLGPERNFSNPVARLTISAVVPEPASIALFAVPFIGLTFLLLKAKKLS